MTHTLYSPASKTWSQLQDPMVSHRSCHALVYYEDNLYLFAGYNGQTVFNDLFCFDTSAYQSGSVYRDLSIYLS